MPRRAPEGEAHSASGVDGSTADGPTTTWPTGERSNEPRDCDTPRDSAEARGSVRQGRESAGPRMMGAEADCARAAANGAQGAAVSVAMRVSMSEADWARERRWWVGARGAAVSTIRVGSATGGGVTRNLCPAPATEHNSCRERY